MTDTSPDQKPGQQGTGLIQWLLASNEPWTRYHTLVDLLDQPEDSATVQAARNEMLAHPQVQTLISGASAWGQRPLKRHNDASHPIHMFSTLADFGVRAQDAGMRHGVEALLSHQSPEGAFQSLLNIPSRFGGTGKDQWSWILCDATTLLYALVAMGLADDPRVQQAVEHLVSTADDNGWRCVAARELGRFRGPGRKGDPCPIATVYALKVLARVSQCTDTPVTRIGIEMLLSHWQAQHDRKIYLFGIGTDFRKLKYPFVWYDILHVVDVLSQFSFVRNDTRFREMVETIAVQAGESGRYTASSMYRAWAGWSFAGKRNPSPWLTFLALRILKRASSGRETENQKRP